jgi:hypothetical protein
MRKNVTGNSLTNRREKFYVFTMTEKTPDSPSATSPVFPRFTPLAPFVVNRFFNNEKCEICEKMSLVIH